MIIANSAPRASLAIYHLISNARSWNNCLNILRTICSGVFSPCVAPVIFCCVFRVNEFNTKEFKRQVEKAKTCRELIQVLKVSVSLLT